jgi:hypothetical protein
MAAWEEGLVRNSAGRKTGGLEVLNGREQDTKTQRGKMKKEINRGLSLIILII